jgi:hypothetical protein
MTDSDATLEHDLYRFACPICESNWNGNDLSKIAKRVAWHWNKEHNGELKHNHRQIDTVERGGHHVHGNEYTVERIPIYITAFDVMERLGKVDGKAVPPENTNICDTCFQVVRQSDEHVVIEESVVNPDRVRCQSCVEKREIEAKEEQNQQITEFATDGGRPEHAVKH